MADRMQGSYVQYGCANLIDDAFGRTIHGQGQQRSIFLVSLVEDATSVYRISRWEFLIRDPSPKAWIFLSIGTILFNKWILAPERFTVILTTWHFLFTTIATQVLSRTTTLLKGRAKIGMTPTFYTRSIAPIGVLYSGSLICSNIAFVYLDVSFSQMLKASGPVVSLLTAWAWRVERPSIKTLINILIITFGVVLTGTGQFQFSWTGFAFQMACLVFDANRLVMVQILLSENGVKMDPLVSLYYTAPSCLLMNAVVVRYTEYASFNWDAIHRTGPHVLLLNALMGFMLNVSIYLLIQKTSGLVMALVSIPKNIVLVLLAVSIWGTQISHIQVIGYTIALLALLYHAVGWGTINGWFTVYSATVKLRL
ncbi:triose-phosphate transporter family-domain-containing protein [Aspergillus ambiguus]|uniref:uncharacterized protein n=1 Tax=Aspergillus ambiguus TaxID=176160 RepID=UPI003CCE0E08